jgi:phosphatidate cytidylyltransferase
MLWKRLLSSILGVPLIIIVAWYGGLYLLLMTALIYWLGLYELMKMVSSSGLTPKPVPAYVGSGIMLFATYIYDQTYSLITLTPVILLFLLTMLLSRERQSLVSVSVTFFGTVYIGLIIYIYLLRNLPDGWLWVTLLLACTWANDTAAYFGGKKFGRVPLAKRISPGKTREGAIFGILGSTAAAFLITVFNPSLPVFTILALGVLVAVAGQVGDLMESVIKRESGVKDAGKLIPGHGGILDRFDSMLLGAPLVYYYAGSFIIS